MARVLKRRRPQPVPRTPLGRLMEEHLEWLLINNYSEDTADHARWAIADFIRWAELRGMQHPMEVTRPILESYQRYLYYYRKRRAAAHVPHAALAADASTPLVSLAGAQQSHPAQPGFRSRPAAHGKAPAENDPQRR